MAEYFQQYCRFFGAPSCEAANAQQYAVLGLATLAIVVVGAILFMRIVGSFMG